MSEGIPVLPNGDPVRRTVLIAANFMHASNWAMYSKVNLRSRNLVFVTDPDRLRGLKDFDVVYYGPYYRHRNWLEIEDTLGHFKYSQRFHGKEYWQYEAYEIEPNVVDR